MAFLFNKFQEGVRALARSSTFAKNPRQLQYEADVNRLFLYTSYNRLGKDAEEADAEEVIDLASKASLADQEQQVQDNIHTQIKTFCSSMDEILFTADVKSKSPEPIQQKSDASRRSGLSLAVGKSGSSRDNPAIPETRPLKLAEVSQSIKDLIGYTLSIKPSQILHKDAGQGLFLDGEADVGTVIAFYPGVIFSPAYYRYIPGYPRVDTHNPYLITRYDGTVINAQPWGSGGETRDIWDGTMEPQFSPTVEGSERGSDRVWKVLSKPLKTPQNSRISGGDVLERRNPLAFAHFANHPAKGVDPNVMVCPYNFPLTEKGMRVYIPNVLFGKAEEVKMRRFGSFWFKSSGSSNSVSDVPVMKTLVLVATRALCNEEVLLNYRLSNSKRRPSWYTPVDEEEDKRRWS